MKEPTSRILQHLRISCSTSCTSFMQLIVSKLDISTPPWSLDLPDGNSCDSFPSLMFRNLSSNGWFTLHLLLDGMYCLYMNMDGDRMSGERLERNTSSRTVGIGARCSMLWRNAYYCIKWGNFPLPFWYFKGKETMPEGDRSCWMHT